MGKRHPTIQPKAECGAGDATANIRGRCRDTELCEHDVYRRVEDNLNRTHDRKAGAVANDFHGQNFARAKSRARTRSTDAFLCAGNCQS